MKAFSYRQSQDRKEAVQAFSAEPEKVMPIGGGQDLLARHQGLCRAARSARQRQGGAGCDGYADARRWAENRRRHEDRRPRGARAGAQAVSPRGAGRDENRHAADPQSGNGRRQPQSAATLLVLSQRGVRLLQEGGQPVCFSPAGENQFHAIFGGGPSFIVHPSSLAVPSVAYGATFRLVGPKGERMVPAADYFTMPTLQNVRTENVLAPDELLTHVILPAARRGQERPLRGPLQDLARLADCVRHSAPDHGRGDGQVGAGRHGCGCADSLAFPGSGSGAGRKAASTRKPLAAAAEAALQRRPPAEPERLQGASRKNRRETRHPARGRHRHRLSPEPTMESLTSPKITVGLHCHSTSARKACTSRLWWTRTNRRFMIHTRRPHTGVWRPRAASGRTASPFDRMSAASGRCCCGLVKKGTHS